jgi:hypothetical protein
MEGLGKTVENLSQYSWRSRNASTLIMAFTFGNAVSVLDHM